MTFYDILKKIGIQPLWNTFTFMEACFYHRINKWIATFSLTIQTFFVPSQFWESSIAKIRNARYKLAILKKKKKKSKIAGYKEKSELWNMNFLFFIYKYEVFLLCGWNEKIVKYKLVIMRKIWNLSLYCATLSWNSNISVNFFKLVQTLILAGYSEDL